jgi:hypothetical protein
LVAEGGGEYEVAAPPSVGLEFGSAKLCRIYQLVAPTVGVADDVVVSANWAEVAAAGDKSL